MNERYIRYLLNEGKMKEKKIYINYKNKILTQLIKIKTEELIWLFILWKLPGLKICW